MLRKFCTTELHVQSAFVYLFSVNLKRDEETENDVFAFVQRKAAVSKTRWS